MVNRTGLAAVLLLLIGGGALTLAGGSDERLSFASVLEIWGDVLRDVDQFGLKLTRVSDRDEMTIGDDIAAEIAFRGRETQAMSAYVAEVGGKLTAHVRRTGMRYRFHVLEGPSVNAFAIPGGHVYVFTGLLEFLHSEAELAAVMGHEISHVDLRHCVERMQYGAALEKVGAGTLGNAADMLRRFGSVEYNKYQELEADAQGARLSAEADYDPSAAVDVFERMQQQFGRADRRPVNPLAELGQALGAALGSYFASHPQSAERSRRLQALVDDYRARSAGKVPFVGTERYGEELLALRRQ
jgi:predicted Zn-dependent protease